MSKSDEIEDSSAPLIEHLAELRTRLIRSVLAFIVGMIISFTVWNPLFNFLTLPLCDALAARDQSCDLQFIALEEGFFVAISISLCADTLPTASAPIAVSTEANLIARAGMHFLAKTQKVKGGVALILSCVMSCSLTD